MTGREGERPGRVGLVVAAIVGAVALLLVALFVARDAVFTGGADGRDAAAERSSTPSPDRDRGVRAPERESASDTTVSAPSVVLRAPVRLSPARAVGDPEVVHGALSGAVLSASDATPVPGAELSFESLGRTLTVSADDQGRFTFTPPDVGTYVLALARGDGFLPFAPEWGVSPIVFVATPGARVEGVVVELVPAVAYAGLVVDADGEPVGGAEVRILGALGEQTLVPIEDRFVTNEEGAFTFRAPDGALLEATHETRGRGRAVLDFAAQATHRLTIRLGPTEALASAIERIAGRVVDAHGDPVPGVLVRAELSVENPAAAGAGLHPWTHGVTDAEGRFELDGLDRGRYRVVAQADGHATRAVDGVVAGARDVVIELGEESVLRGVVRDRETGAGVAASTVVVSRARSSLVRESVATASTFGADGRFEVRRLVPGTYLVTATAHGHAPSEETQVVLDDGVAEVELALGRGGAIAGVVTSSEGGAPIAGARASLEGRLGAEGTTAVPLVRSASTDARGRFEIVGVPPGPQSLFVAGANHHARVLSGLAVSEGGRLEIAVDLTPTEEGEAPRVELAGIGVVIGARGDELVIGRTVEGGGAAEAGLGEGDAILAVDGVPVTELGFPGAIERLRGPEGSTVTLRVRRARSETFEDITVARRRIRA